MILPLSSRDSFLNVRLRILGLRKPKSGSDVPRSDVKDMSISMTVLYSRDSPPHCSYDDPDDKQEVISIRRLDNSNKRISSIHVHEDGTSK